jgi:uncharacterized protein with GYD domain
MSIYMWMGKYTPAAALSIVEGDSDREQAARVAVESVGGKLLGFYGMMGQEHHIVMIADMPSKVEYLGVAMAASLSGAIESFKTIPLYDNKEAMAARKAYKIA